jgi:alpha-methylacyl-CoA racemase
MLGRAGEAPYPPGNILGDFAGGGAICFLGVLLALMSRQRTGKGQVVNANMVDGSAYLATMPRLMRKSPMWSGPRGTNTLDGGCPYYGTYETKDAGNYFAIGPLEPQFYAELLKGLGFNPEDVLPPNSNGSREDPRNWPYMKAAFEKRFKEKTRKEWESIFDGTDACATPVLTQDELENAQFDQRPVVGLSETPGLDYPAEEGGWIPVGLGPGVGGEETLSQWAGWKRGRDFEVKNGALVKAAGAKL